MKIFFRVFRHLIAKLSLHPARMNSGSGGGGGGGGAAGRGVADSRGREEGGDQVSLLTLRSRKKLEQLKEMSMERYVTREQRIVVTLNFCQTVKPIIHSVF